MRTTGSENKCMKYKCNITLMGNTILDKEYPSLKQIANDIEVPYHTITDMYEGRRTSYQKFAGTKYFPDFTIKRIDEKIEGKN